MFQCPAEDRSRATLPSNRPGHEMRRPSYPRPGSASQSGVFAAEATARETGETDRGVKRPLEFRRPEWDSRLSA